MKRIARDNDGEDVTWQTETGGVAAYGVALSDAETM